MRIDPDLAARLVAAQFPEWSTLTVSPVAAGGWDNRSFRLGDDLLVRLPSAAGYAPQVEKEQRWLPVLAPHLPLPIPTPVAQGRPSEDFPLPWSVYRWIDGETAGARPPVDRERFAADLGAFLAALNRVPADGGPGSGPHSAYRGGPLSRWDAETRTSIERLGDGIPAKGATALWEAALAAEGDDEPRWFHGDVAAGNLLVRDGRLSAVIDFGCAGVGDPACDTVIAWTLFDGASRAAFRAAYPVSDDVWMRGRGWALWKSVITMVHELGDGAAERPASTRAEGRPTLEALLGELHG